MWVKDTKTRLNMKIFFFFFAENKNTQKRRRWVLRDWEGHQKAKHCGYDRLKEKRKQGQLNGSICDYSAVVKNDSTRFSGVLESKLPITVVLCLLERLEVSTILNHSFGMNVEMHFKAQQLGSLVNCTFCSERSQRHVFMAATNSKLWFLPGNCLQ